MPKDQVAVRFDARRASSMLYQRRRAERAELRDGFPGDRRRSGSASIPTRIECRSGDPDGPALIGGASIGSRSAMSQGSVFKIASDEIIRKGLTLAADALEAAAADIEFRDGRYFVKGTDRVASP